MGTGWFALVWSRDCLEGCDAPPAVLALFVLRFRVVVRFEPLPDPRLRLLAVPRPDCARPVARLPD